MLKIMIIGSNGQLGSEITKRFSNRADVIGLTHSDIEISEIGSVKAQIELSKPDVVVNTAAYHNVMKCEENPDQAMRVNAAGVFNLVRICSDYRISLVQVSTDYIFDGKKGAPYIEADFPNPLNIYAVSKLAGEYIVQNYSERFYILRVSGIYGTVACRAKGGNFITTMLRAAEEREVVKVVDDEILTPTPVSDIAENLWTLIRNEAYGTYHMTAEGECSWYEFARVIFDQLGLKTPLKPCKVADFPMIVKRPTYSVLENQRLKAIGLNEMRPWRENISEFLAENYQ